MIRTKLFEMMNKNFSKLMFNSTFDVIYMLDPKSHTSKQTFLEKMVAQTKINFYLGKSPFFCFWSIQDLILNDLVRVK